MIITDVECMMLRLPEVLPIGDGTQDVLIVRVHTDEGITGIGECHTSPWALKAVIEAPMSAYAARGLKDIVVGQNPLEMGRIWERMYQLSMVYGRRGLVMHAMSAVDIALWDIAGKVYDQPIHRLLGGAFRSAVPAYASTLAAPDRSETLRRVDALVSEGFRGIKFGWGQLGKNIQDDMALVADVRRTVGPDVDLMVDIGTPIPLRKAQLLSEGLAEHGVYFLEEPLSPDDLAGYRILSSSSPVPIASGEKEQTRHGFRELMETGVHIIQPDLARAGGFTESRRISDLAEHFGTTVIPHCWSTDILVSATLHFIAALTECPYMEFCVADNPIRRQVIRDPIDTCRGMVRVPDGPGLGIELNEDTIDRLRYA